MAMLRHHLSIRSWVVFVGTLLSATSGICQQIVVDTATARAVLKALQSQDLTYDQAIAIAKLEGNQGMIKEMKYLGEAETDEQFARALVTAAHGLPASTQIEQGYNFQKAKATVSNESIISGSDRAEIPETGSRCNPALYAAIGNRTSAGIRRRRLRRWLCLRGYRFLSQYTEHR
jgi:hypothetical protein